ncbi:MAG TPA: hypothetical protein VF020_09510 [Chthoniobacterales bacterium]
MPTTLGWNEIALLLALTIVAGGLIGPLPLSYRYSLARRGS